MTPGFRTDTGFLPYSAGQKLYEAGTGNKIDGWGNKVGELTTDQRFEAAGEGLTDLATLGLALKYGASRTKRAPAGEPPAGEPPASTEASAEAGETGEAIAPPRTIAPKQAPGIKDAMQAGAEAPGDAAAKADAIRPLLEERSRNVGAWEFFENTGSDGTKMFHGRAGEAIIIRPDGAIFGGRIPTGIADTLRYERGDFTFDEFTGLHPFEPR